MKVYITKVVKEDGEYAGPKISALSWKGAEKQAAKQGAILVGELA